MSRLFARSPSREGLLWKGYALVALALAILYFLLGGHTDSQSVIYQLFILAAPIAILVGVRRYRPDPRRQWLLFAGGLALWGIGDTYWDSYLWILGKEAPYPSFADVAYLSAYPLLIAGAFVLVRGWGRPRIGSMLDAAIVALAAGIVAMLFLLAPLMSTSESLFAKAIAVGFPVMDFVMLVALMQLMFRRRKVNFALRAIIVGTAVLLVSDSAYSYLGLDSAYTPGMSIDAGWLACYALWGIAALHPSMARIRSLPEHEGAELTIWRIGTLLLGLLAAPIVLIVQTLTGDSIETGKIGTVIVATSLLVAARVWLLQRDSKKAQTALARSDERLRIAQGVVGISTWEMDLVTNELEVSEQLAALISGPRDTEVTLEDWVAFIDPKDREQITADFDYVRKHGGHFAHEYRYRSPDGEEGSLFSRGKVFLGEDGTHARAVGVAVDVTGRHAMEEQLERSEERLQLAQKLGGVGTWDTNLVTGEIIWSQSLRQMSGVDDDVEPTDELFAQLVHVDDRPGLAKAMKESIDEGREFECEYRLTRPNDDEERWILTRGQRVTDENGRAIRFLGIAVDITERHAFDEQLKQSDERFRMAEAAGNLGSWDLNLKTGVFAWSDSLRRQMNVAPELEPTYEAFLDWVHPDDRALVDRAVSESLEGGTDFEIDYRFRRRDGSEGWMESRGRGITDDEGAPMRSIGVAVDITDRHVAEELRTKLEQQLRQAHKLEAVGRLAGGVAHDFNNILLAIRGNGELALDALKHDADPIEEVEEMVAAAERAAALTNQLLAFSRRQVLQAEVLDLNEVVTDMDKLLRRMIGEDIELNAVVSADPALVNADRSQIEQVIANLAVNARDAMPGGGLLTLEVTTTEIGAEKQVDLAPGLYAMLSVSDTGIGMDSETVAKIFEPFFTTKEEGTGFGLATVHGIVVQSGGSIWVYSEIDHGTTFKVFLPLAEQAAASLESKATAKVAAITESAGETILLVEDDPHVQRIVKNILSRSGYRVLSAGGAEEALRLAADKGDTIHLLLSDLVMPGTSGRELAEQIQVLRPDISILYMSGYTDDVVIRRGVLEAGMAFIQKPFGADDLSRRVRELLDRRAAQPEAA